MATSYPEAADPERYRWLTGHPYVARREAALLARLPAAGGRLLEIGAGEGANLHHLGAGPGSRAVALDSALEKLRFGKASQGDVEWVTGDARKLPFAAGRFQTALLRDVLHHVPEREQVLAEAARVVAPGGRLCVLEANGATLLARVFSRLFAHERGLAGSTFQAVLGCVLATPGLRLERAELVEPAPLWRLFFHHRFGLPGLGGSRAAVRLVEALERAWARAGASGSYSLIVARKE